MKTRMIAAAVMSAASMVLACGAQAGELQQALQVFGTPAAGTSQIEVGFSPEGSAEALVLKAIASAHRSIRLIAYSFTSAPVAIALAAAKRRGVDVAVVVDAKNNLHEDRSGVARAALNLMVNVGIPTRTISVYDITHDKTAIIDSETVETGSFNYSSAAATRNSENAIVIWHDAPLAKQYLAHWESRWQQGVPYQSTY